VATTLNAGSTQYVIRTSREPGIDGDEQTIRDVHLAEQFLARFVPDWSNMAALRRLARETLFIGSEGTDDRQVIRRIASAIAGGGLQVYRVRSRWTGATSSSPDKPSAPETPVAPKKEDKKDCWIADYDKEVSTASYGRYSQPYKKDGTPHSYTDRVQYKIYAPVKTGSAITIEIRFKVEALAGVNETEIATAKTKLENGVQTHWSGKFKMEIDDPQCGKKTLPINYKVVWVSAKEHYTIKVHKTYPREGVTGRIMNVQKKTSAWTYAHEFAHCFGMPDEYSYTPDTETVKYYKPDGTLDAAISAPPGGKAKDAADATIMSAVDNTTTLSRHAWYAAIEVQALLTAKIGRKIKCDIK
jgi:hypothetical protein